MQSEQRNTVGNAKEGERDALLLLVHKITPALKALLKIMDNGRFDFFVHVDAKVRDFPNEELERIVRNGKLIFVDRVEVGWGTPAMVRAEMSLFRTASATAAYRYYHLLSGADMPLKRGDEIFDFFRDREECFIETEPMHPLFTERVTLYHPESLIVSPALPAKPAVKARRTLARAWAGINRRLHFLQRSGEWMDDGHVYRPLHGSQWGSLPEKAVKFLVEKEKLVEKIIRHTFAPDEMYKQTILGSRKDMFVISSADEADLRYIDWSADSPHPATLTEKDFPALAASSTDLFARKFDGDVGSFLRYFKF